MTPAEAQVLIGMAASVDNRKPDEDVARSWAALLDGLRFEDCRVAVIEHFKTSNDWLTPALIRASVKRIRSKRIENHPPLTPPPGPPGETEGELIARQQAWLKEARRRIGDGEVIDCDATYELKPRHLPDLRELMPAEGDPT